MMSTHTYNKRLQILQNAKQIQSMSKRRIFGCQSRLIKAKAQTQNPQQYQRRKPFFKQTIRTQISQMQPLQTIYNKNISKFRDLVNSNDKSLLPFICSLRSSSVADIKLSNTTKINKTIVEPFLVAGKETSNQKINKDMNDIKGRTKRISNALYRWHNCSGSGIKESCLFEATLRQTSNMFRKKTTFQNMFNHLQKPKSTGRLYTESDIICPKQKRIFNFSSN